MNPSMRRVISHLTEAERWSNEFQKFVPIKFKQPKNLTDPKSLPKHLQNVASEAQHGARVVHNGKTIWSGLGNRSGLHSYAQTAIRDAWEKSGQRFLNKLATLPNGKIELQQFRNIDRDRGNWKTYHSHQHQSGPTDTTSAVQVKESAAIIYHYFYGNRTGIHTGPVPGANAPIGEHGMNMQQVRLANTQHILVQQRGGARTPTGYAIGEQLRTNQDVDLQVEQEILSIPKGTTARVKENNSQQLLLDLGEGLGDFVMELAQVGQYFERLPKTESEVRRNIRTQIHESNPTVVTPGAYVEVTGYDANIGPNRGPKSPGMGGYATLVGQKGMIATIYGEVKGIKTYKIQLERGGEFVLGETEFKVITGVGTQESLNSKPPIQEIDYQSLRGVGFGM